MNKSLLIYLFWGIVCTSIQANPFLSSFATNDTVPVPSSYDGHRLYISDIGIYQVKPNWMRIQYIATNTGRQTLEINKKQTISNLQIRFDESLSANYLEAYADQIRKVLVLKKIKLAPGEKTGLENIKFYTNAAKYQQEEKIAEIVEKAPPIQATKTLPSPKVTQTKNTSNEATLETKGGNASARTSERMSTADLVKEKENCPDLVIGGINVLKKSKKSITLEYTITNQGKGKAKLFGTNKEKGDNAAVVAYMSGSPKLSRGAINLKGQYVTEGTGILEPNQSQKGVIKLDIRTQTRYTPVIILSLDAFRTAKECDRTNNTTHIVVQ